MKKLPDGCAPCHGEKQLLPASEIAARLKKLPGWKPARRRKAIGREYKMEDFSAAVRLIHAVAAVAEKQGHHPDLHLTGYRNLRIELSTHAVKGLTNRDFVLAGKIEKLPKRLRKIRGE